MLQQIRPTLVSLLLLTLITGVAYPLIVTGIAQVAFPHQANGSLIVDKAGKPVGSTLIGQAFDDPQAKRRIEKLVRTLGELGWTEGKNLRIDYRLGSDQDAVRNNAAELVALAPDVIVANAPPSVQALQRLTQAIPVVFTAVVDPVALGFVQSMARPGGNLTGLLHSSSA